MTHSVILNNFSLPWLIKALESELGRLIFRVKCYKELDTPEKELDYILENLIPRWNCVFKSTEIDELYKYKAFITIAVILNKYGYNDNYITKNAIEGLKRLKNDKYGLLPSHQYKKIDSSINLLDTKVKYNNKKTKPTNCTTQFRKGDVFSIKFDNSYLVAIVKKIELVNEYPIVQVYKNRFKKKPTISEVLKTDLIEKQIHVTNLLFIPDMANQFEIIDTIKTEYEFYGGPVYDIYQFLNDVKKLISEK